MHFGTDTRADRLRAEARDFVAGHLTPAVKARVAESGNYHDDEFHQAMAERGWVGAHWAREEGGQAWPRALSDVVYEELAAAGAPVEGLAITQIIGEAIRRVGTPEQRAAFLRPICRGEIVLALGYSEPGAGSDLASVRTRAVRDGDQWVVNGQKIFTTMGSAADYVFLLARTDPDAPKHAGLTLFLVPTDSPGFSASPIFTLSGQRTNVTYYSDLRIDDSARLGDEGQGWEIVNVALAFERGGEFAAQLRRLVTAGVQWARDAGRSDDPSVLARLGRAATSSEVARLLGAYASWSRQSVEAGAVEGTIAKVYGTEALQRASGSLLDAAGVDGLANPDSTRESAAAALQHLYRESQIATIYGGTSEVLKTVIAQQRLGLPRPPRTSSR
ncbi:acyl-CoA dehydrogenase family protein [Mumia qirimensis]|uniref:acyl-CoA dehydrogenase family protein n=1 Tax=Mumia qirimensis TaxID=3234852 RepID=UPI00351D335F